MTKSATKRRFSIGKTEAGQEVAPGVVFLGWRGVARNADGGVKCPKCSGYAEKVDSTPGEIASDLNCGRSWACCCAAFKCSVCGVRLVGKREAPEME